MINKNDWIPSKFEMYKGHWRSSRKEVGIASRLNADCIARSYERLLTRYAKGNLVDLGCGNAPLVGMYRDRVLSYMWCDWPNSPHRIYQIDAEVDLNKGLPFGDMSFDTVLLSDVLEHVAQPDQLFVEIVRILKMNGIVILGVPFLYCIHEMPHDYYRYTRFKLQDFANIHGLDIVELQEYAGGLDVVQDILSKIFSFSLFTKWLAYLVYYFFQFIKRLPWISGINAQLTKKFPLGYVCVFQKA